MNQLARMSTETLLNCMLEGIAIGLFAWILLRLVGRRNSSTRFAVWFSALLAIAALPVLRFPASGSMTREVITLPGSWALDIFIVWAVIAALSLLRVGIGLLQLQKLRASFTPIDLATLDPLLRATLQDFQSVRPVALCHSGRVQIPSAIGFRKPAVVIPSWALRELSTVELNSILIHELAHLRRWDDWTNLAQQVLKALLFFHPAVWWIESQLALEREMACDDAVLAETGNPRGYAQCLISMAEKSFLRRGLALAQAAVNRMRQTSLRVSRILDRNRPGATRIWKPALYSVAAFFVACLASLSHAPELVAFKDRAPEAPIASALPASRALTSAAGSNFALETAVTFRAKSSAQAPRHAQARRTREWRVKSPAPQNANDRIWEGAVSSVPLFAELRPQERTVPLASQSADSRIWEGSSSLVPQSAADKSGLEPLGQRSFADPALSVALNDRAAPQAIFVVMQTQYHESLSTSWRITVITVWHLPAETRIPAKQI